MSEDQTKVTRGAAELSDAVAAATPAPGGGTSAAAACAFAAALTEMTARFTLGPEDQSEMHPRIAELAARAGVLRERALELAERELTAYEPVIAALRLAPDDPARPAQLARALSDAAESPMELCRTAHEVAALAAEAARIGTRHLRGDARTGMFLAEAACQAAAELVRINLAGSPEDPRFAEAGRLAEAAAALRDPPGAAPGQA